MTFTKWLTYSLFGVAAAALLAAAMTPSLRSRVQNYFARGREVLATADGNLLNDGSLAKVIKYRTDEGIFVEIVRLDDGGKSSPVDRLLLPDKHDGLFNFKGHVTRLAIADIDNDGKRELLAPTFDDQLVPHLNVFQYNPDLKRFEPYRPMP